MPLAARRALDAVGVKLSLEAWQNLEMDARWTLVEAGAADVVDEDAVHRILHGVLPPPKTTSPWRVPESPSETLRATADPASLQTLWPSLSPLERYALEKLARSPRRDADDVRGRLHSALTTLLADRAPQDGSSRLTHLDERGQAKMVDVGEKAVTKRVAVAEATVRMQPETLALLRRGDTPKGDVLATARIAGIQAAKRTSELIPLCHLVALSGVRVELELDDSIPGVRILATAKTMDRTGVEMEALVAASVAGLTLYDMLKAVDRGMVIGEVALVSKSGGRSGDYLRGER